ncbi:MAG: hypothetical protein WCH30_01420 [Chlorobiaceae bacterium]
MKQDTMMKQHNEKIEAEVSKTMNLLDEFVPLELHHQFRVRLMRRVESEIGLERGGQYFGIHFDYRLAFMALIFVINLASTLLSVQQGDESTTTISEVSFIQSDNYANQEFAYYDQTAFYENQAP